MQGEGLLAQIPDNSAIFYVRTVPASHPSLQAVIVIPQLMIPTPLVLLIQSVSSASVFPRVVTAILTLKIQTVFVLLVIFAR